MYQQITIIGNVGRDPDLRYTQTGAGVCSFSVAVNRKWTNSDGSKGEKTTWFKVSAWNNLADICNQYVHKGMLIMVVGEVDVSTYTGDDGQPRYSLELKAREVKFLGKHGDASDSVASNDSEYQQQSSKKRGQDDIPF